MKIKIEIKNEGKSVMNIVNINPSVSVVSALNEPMESCFQTLVLETTLESSLDSKEVKPFIQDSDLIGFECGLSIRVLIAPLVIQPRLEILCSGVGIHCVR